MALSSVEESLLVAAYYRGGSGEDECWTSCSDQVVTLSLFYTGDISSEECARRFSHRRYVDGLYEENGTLNRRIATRYRALIGLIRTCPELIEGGGNLELPADPTDTACRLTVVGLEAACGLIPSFPRKPEFPNWPDRRTFPGTH